MGAESPYKAEDYTVGWICALPVELAASAEVLDIEHPPLPHEPKDSNSYTLGSIAGHNIVIGCLPFGQIGLVSAASVATQMKLRFPSIRFGLMVGIGGGVPNENADIRLGDVVISLPSGQYGGVVQYDMGKILTEGQSIRTGSLNAPPQILLTALAAVEAARLRERFNLKGTLSSLEARLSKFAYPQKLQDRLYKSTYAHIGRATCAQCSEDQLEDRPDRDDSDVAIHYGTIASGNQVIKDGVQRDRLSSELGGVLCFEMEAAGLMNNFPCVVIRGICDYADSHKNKGWQPYATATAAAFAKGLLELIPATEVVKEPTIEQTMKGLKSMVANTTELSQRIEEKISTAEENSILQWLSAASFSKPQNMAREVRTPGTGQWLLDLKTYLDWRDSTPGLLWVYGAAGSGKTVLCSAAIEDIYKKNHQKLAYWYFQFSNESTQRISNCLRSLLRQLSTTRLADCVIRLWEDHNRTGSEPGIEELASVLDEVIYSHKERVFIVIDALDECPQTPDQPERGKLLGLVLDLRRKHNDILHILITSRPEHDIHSSISPYPSINLETFVSSDVKHFVTNSLQSGKLNVWDANMRQQIEDRLLSIETKRFRWADLQIRRLQSCYTHDQIQEALRTIPQSLGAAYEEALNNIPRKDAKIARLILMWLTFSLRPMSIHEIAAAAQLPHPEFVLRICTSILITLIHEDRDTVIKLAHFSVKEYLVSDAQKDHLDETSFSYHFSSNLAHSTICNTSISYLLGTNDTKASEQLVIDKPLLPYSADYWLQHVAAISENITCFPQLTAQISRLFSPNYSESYRNWHKIYERSYTDQGGAYGTTNNWDESEHGERDDPNANYAYRCPPRMYYAAMLGFDHLVRELLKNDNEISAEWETLEFSCTEAAIHGNSKIVEMLLADARCHLQRRHLERILTAVNTNREDIVRVLLNAGALSTSRDSKEHLPISEWALETAVGSWENGLEITKALFEHLGTHAHSLITERVIQAAARNGLSGVEVLQLLLDRRPEHVNITEGILQAAAGNRLHGAEIMTLLLKQKALNVCLSQELVKEAAKNTKSGKEVISLLLQHLDCLASEGPERLFGLIVESFDEDVARLFLNIYVHVEVTDEVFKSGARNSKHRDQILRLLVKLYLDRVGPEGEIPEEVQRGLGIWAYGGMKKLDLEDLEASSSPSKGRLELQVYGLRGLQECEEVYVVAVFQQNEFISKTYPTAWHRGSDAFRIQVPSLHEPNAFPVKVERRRHRSNIDISEHHDDSADYQAPEQLTRNIKAVFDVVSSDPQLSLTVYGRQNGQGNFLGHVNIEARLAEKSSTITGWFQLKGRTDDECGPWGEINIALIFQQGAQQDWKPEDFEIVRLIGKGIYGQVYQVRKRDTQRVYAMKVISKKIIVKKKEIARFIGERNILVRATTTNSPFITGLKFAFQTPADLYLATDFMDGGELFWHLIKVGRFDEAHTRFYAAELLLALQHLHLHGIIYRDLKPENILLDANGHIALSDFSLSKMLVLGATTNSFCGNPEYLAPEVLLDETGYTRMVDFWSLGVLMYEMSCGWSPFYSEDTHQIYKNIAFGKVRFPRDYLTAAGRALIKGLLQRNPRKRLGATHGAEEVKGHAFFSTVDWDTLSKKLTPPPIIPQLGPVPRQDASGFDPEFANAPSNSSSLLAARAAGLTSGLPNQTPLSPSMQAAFQGFTFVNETTLGTTFSYDHHVNETDAQLSDNRGVIHMAGNSHDSDAFFDGEDGFEVW